MLFGYWNATDRPQIYLRTLIVMHVTNVVLNWVLIFGHLGFEPMGVAGLLGPVPLQPSLERLSIYSWPTDMDVTKGFSRSWPGRQVFQKLMAVSWPAGVQQLFLATGYSTLFWVIGCVGAMELAVANVLLNITLVGVLPLLGLGLASEQLVGQALVLKILMMLVVGGGM